MKRKYFIRCTIIFLSVFVGQFANAQELSVKERQVVSALETSSQGLTSWKSTGITTFQSSQSFRDKLNSASQKFSAKHGTTPPKYKPKYGFDRIQAFFCATRGDKMLCAEEELTVSPETYTPPFADIKALNDFVAAGHTQVHDKGRNYSVDGERRGLTFNNLTSHRVVSRNSTGFYVAHTNLKPQELIRTHNFRLVGETDDENFKKILVFSGNCPIGRGSYPFIFHLAPEFGYRVVYSEMINKPANIRQSQKIKSLVNVGGHWLPQTSQDEVLSYTQNNAEPDLITAHQFANHSVNDVTDDMLSVKSRDGDHEWNQKDNTGYKIGVNNEKIFIDSNEANNPKKFASGWLYMASVTTLLVF